MLGTRSVDGRRARAASTGPADQAVARRRASAAVETTNRRAHGLRVAALAIILHRSVLQPGLRGRECHTLLFSTDFPPKCKGKSSLALFKMAARKRGIRAPLVLVLVLAALVSRPKPLVATMRAIPARACSALVLRLRGAGRRRRDWQSPRPGDSDDVVSSLETDPDWSLAAAEESSERPVRRAILGAGSAWSSADSSSEGSSHSGARRPRQNAARRARRAAGRQPQRPAAHGRNRGLVAHRDVPSDDGHAPRPRPRRAAAASAPTAERWGTRATDALEAALRGKMGASVERFHGRARSRRPTQSAGRRTWRVADTAGDESSGVVPSSSSAQSGRGNMRRAAPAALIEPSTNAHSELHEEPWRKPFAVAPHGTSTSLVDDTCVPRRPDSARNSSPAGAAGSVLPFVQSGAISVDSGDSWPAAGGNVVSEGRAEDDIEFVDGNGLNQELYELSERLKHDSEALFLAHGAQRAWRALKLARGADAADGDATRGPCHSSLSYSAPSKHATQQSWSSGSRPAVERGGVLAGEAAWSAIPVSTEGVLQGMGKAMAQAAEEVAGAGQRTDLECTGMVDELATLAQRLDTARKQGEAVAALLHSPQQLAGRGAEKLEVLQAADSDAGGVARATEEQLRGWRRRAVVSGTWHRMREQAEALCRIVDLKPPRPPARAPGPGSDPSSPGAGCVVYVGGSGHYNMTGEEVEAMMLDYGRVVGWRKTDTHSFVEFAEPAMAAAAVRASAAGQGFRVGPVPREKGAAKGAGGACVGSVLVLAAPHGRICRSSVSLQAPFALSA